MGFEKDMEALEKIVEQLNHADVPLEESIKLFEKGILLSKQAMTTLADGEGKINILKTQLDELLQGVREE